MARIVASLCAVLLASIGLLLARTAPDPSPPRPPRRAEFPVAARSAPPRAPPGPLERRFVGVILAHHAVDLAARVDGRIEKVFCSAGDQRRRGESIAVLDGRARQQELRRAAASQGEAEANLLQASVSLDQARARRARIDSLGDAMAPQERETARFEERKAEAQVALHRATLEERKAEVERLRALTSDLVVRAPFDGSIAVRYVDPGATVAAGAPIVRILSEETPRARFAVPEALAAMVQRGARCCIELRAAPLRFEATVEQVAPEIDPATRMVFAEATLQDSPSLEQLPSGLVVDVALISTDLAAKGCAPALSTRGGVP